MRATFTKEQIQRVIDENNACTERHYFMINGVIIWGSNSIFISGDTLFANNLTIQINIEDIYEINLVDYSKYSK